MSGHWYIQFIPCTACSTVHMYVQLIVPDKYTRGHSVSFSTCYTSHEFCTAGNFRGFHSWPNICENKIGKLNVPVVLSRDCGQHLQKFYP